MFSHNEPLSTLQAYACLRQTILTILAVKRKAPVALGAYTPACSHVIDKCALESCLGVVVLALSLVMAGTGGTGSGVGLGFVVVN